jgi:MFS family permease
MGSLTFISTAPLFILSPFMGAIVDKYNRHKLLILVQSLYILQTLLMTIIAFSGLLNLTLIVTLGVFINTVASLDAPLRQSSFVLLVDDPKDLGNAISLNASCFNLARFIGPSIGGLIIGYLGAKYCFLLNFLVLVPTFFLIKAMKIKDVKNEDVKRKYFSFN